MVEFKEVEQIERPELRSGVSASISRLTGKLRISIDGEQQKPTLTVIVAVINALNSEYEQMAFDTRRLMDRLEIMKSRLESEELMSKRHREQLWDARRRVLELELELKLLKLKVSE